MNIGERIKKRREELGLSQDELAKLMGYTSRTTINKIEKGANNLRQTKVREFAKHLNCSPVWLLGLTDQVDSRKDLFEMLSENEINLLVKVAEDENAKEKMIDYIKLLCLEISNSDNLQ